MFPPESTRCRKVHPSFWQIPVHTGSGRYQGPNTPGGRETVLPEQHLPISNKRKGSYRPGISAVRKYQILPGADGPSKRCGIAPYRGDLAAAADRALLRCDLWLRPWAP